MTRQSGRRLLTIAVVLAIAGVALLVVGLTILARGRAATAEQTARTRTLRQDAAVPPGTPAPVVAVESSPTSPAAPLPSPSGTPPAATPAPATQPPVAAPAPPSATRTGAKLDSYRGLGSWVDIYDDRAWADPAAAVADMASHGVKTLYLETGNSGSAGDLFKPAQLQQFITAAHARDMKVVAWYLPEMKDLSRDYSRIEKAISLTTLDGQKFDSFALDIESGAVKPQSKRNAALMSLSARIRDRVGPSYPLGAIVPSPVGLTRPGSYWSAFPYGDLAGVYDVILPMSYYTYHGKGAAAAYADTLGNVRIIRASKGASAIPIHLIGGESEKSSTAEVAAFVRASQETGCIGAGLYGWQGTKAPQWRELKAVSAGR
jgi:hypothetical protein